MAKAAKTVATLDVRGGSVPNARSSKPFAYREEMRATMLGALSQGSTYRAAAGAAGIPWQTWMGWSRLVREGACPDPDVEALVLDARQTFEAANVALATNINVASLEDWKAAAWLLDHRQGDPKARADARRAKYEAEIAKNRAAGTHVENVRNVTDLNDDDLRAEAKRLLDGEGAADGSLSRTTH